LIVGTTVGVSALIILGTLVAYVFAAQNGSPPASKAEETPEQLLKQAKPASMLEKGDAENVNTCGSK
jgi:hypothetical protein